MKWIKVRGACVNNLKNVSADIPKFKLIVITGPSGSGKSTLAFDILYAEGQRRYVESLSSYARQFLERIEKPNVESIEGLSPAIAINQRGVSSNPRSTVGTITESYDYLRLLFAHIGKPYCYKCGRPIVSQNTSDIVEKIKKRKDKKIIILAPVVLGRKGEFLDILENLKKEGFVRVRIDGKYYLLEDEIKLNKNKKHNLFLVIDRLLIRDDLDSRLYQSVELALKKGNGFVYTSESDKQDEIFSEKLACPACGISYKKITPQSFSFNNPQGACKLCGGLGVKHMLDIKKLIPDENLSLREGAIKPWKRKHYKFYQVILREVCEYFDIDMYKPFKELSEREKDIILHGTAGKEIEFYFKRDGNLHTYKKPFEGVINLIGKQFVETESSIVRREIKELMKEFTCPECKGKRLNKESLSVRIQDKNIVDITDMPVSEAYKFFLNLEKEFTPWEKKIAGNLLEEIKNRLNFLINVGLDYLTLSRSAYTLSGGESQRIRLATQAGSKLTGVLYILDEPSIGLHASDTCRLINTLKSLQDNDNTVIVVEHNEAIIKAADWVIDMGPSAGIYGGKVVARGTPKDIEKSDALTGLYLSKKKCIEKNLRFRKAKNYLRIIGAKEHNLKNIDVDIPLGIFVCVTGPSGSGKSSLIFDTLYPCAMNILYGLDASEEKCKNIEGIENIDKIIHVDQSPIGKTPRSNPATYTGVFTDIRELYAQLPESKMAGYTPARFSFNVKGGRCERCRGEGSVKIEMQFLPDVYVSCDACGGKRYNEETLRIKYKGKSIADVLDMTVEEAWLFFKNIVRIEKKLKLLRDIGLGYIKLGQSATTLSGGEAQRIKLVRELIHPQTGKTLYLLDEPSVGLHPDDINKLLSIIDRLVGLGNTVVVIEHDLDIIKRADYIIDLGPEGGEKGGKVVAYGTPQEIIHNPYSITGKYLKEKIEIEDNYRQRVAK